MLKKIAILATVIATLITGNLLAGTENTQLNFDENKATFSSEERAETEEASNHLTKKAKLLKLVKQYKVDSLLLAIGSAYVASKTACAAGHPGLSSQAALFTAFGVMIPFVNFESIPIPGIVIALIKGPVAGITFGIGALTGSFLRKVADEVIMPEDDALTTEKNSPDTAAAISLSVHHSVLSSDANKTETKRNIVLSWPRKNKTIL
ncbi:MAG: hypothetical protein H6618_06535 [Deltaproteobacteria bacterium]|nr:hypothetical protein [Deltaproteobacteria bacterium]